MAFLLVEYKLYNAFMKSLAKASRVNSALQVIQYMHYLDKSGQRYDFILDVVASRSIFDYKRALSPSGVFVMVGGSLAAILQAFLLGPLISMTGNKKMGIVMWKPNNKEDLAILEELFEAGKVVPIIDRRYPLSETAEALQYLEEGHARGKIVITLE
jgi:pentatricopeptide repeat protein